MNRENSQPTIDEIAMMAKHYRTLLDINNAVVMNLRREDLLPAICEALKRVISFDAAALSFYEPQLNALRFFALEGLFHSDYFVAGIVLGLEDSVSGEAFKTQRPVVRGDLQKEQVYSSERRLAEAGVRSTCIAPLIVRGQSIGTINLTSAKKNQYSESEAGFLQEVAHQVALAVANMNAYEKLLALGDREAKAAERRRTLLEINNAVINSLTQDDLLRAVCAAIKAVLPFDVGGLQLYEPELQALRVFSLVGDEAVNPFVPGQLIPFKDDGSQKMIDFRLQQMERDLALERRHLLDEHIYQAGIRSYCSVPLLLHKEFVGTLGIGSAQANQYSDADLEFLQEIANQIALAVANVRAYGEIKTLSAREGRLAEHRRTLLEINNAIVTNLTQQDLCEAVFTALRRIVPFDRVGLSLFDYQLDAYRIIALEGKIESQYFKVGRLIKRQEHWVTEEFNLIQPLLHPDLEIIERNSFEEQLFIEGIRSFCAVPLLVQNKVIGALSVTSVTRNQYANPDVELLQEVANQVALAIANMQAYEEVAALKSRLQAENVYLQEEIRQEHNFDEIVGNSPAILETLHQVEGVARTDSTVLILGETGTGKELIARAIHNLSVRKNRPLVKVNCGAISAGLVESELFGHLKGAFTGAVDKRTGRFELAHGGTLFLDEVGELPLETQVKLLRVLQEGEFEPVGSSKTVQVDVRIIAATNRNLEEEIRAGRFRADLYYRLNVFPITVPALRDRRSDIPQLAMFFVSKFAKKFAKPIENVSQKTMEMLVDYSWLGNIRELQNIIERAVVTTQGSTLTIDRNLLAVTQNIDSGDRHPVKMIAVEAQSKIANQPSWSINPTANSTVFPSLEDLERQHIIAVLEQKGWVIEGERGAARALNLHPNTLRSRLKKLGIQRPNRW
jgi:formate hydrogenlyase transcriptional activator